MINFQSINLLGWLYDISLNSNGINFVFFSYFRIYTLTYTNIKSIKEISHFSLKRPLAAVNFKNRFGARTFWIEKKKGIFTRHVLVTPGNPDNFIKALLLYGVNVNH